MKRNVHALIADIGATNSRIAMVYSEDLTQYHEVVIYSSTEFNSPDEIVRDYCAAQNISIPSLIVLAIAAPVELDEIHFVNNHWRFKLSEVRQKLSMSSVAFFNDVEMLGYALPHLPKTSLVQIGGGELNEFSPKLAMSVGSGVGTSLTIHHKEWCVIPSEGGHASMMMDNQFISDFWAYLRAQGRNELIVEDFIAGKKGIPQLLSFMKTDPSMVSDFNPKALLDDLIRKKDAFAVQLFTKYCAMIGSVAKNYTLITGAKSVYLAGGIIPSFLEFFAQSEFRSSFEDSPSVGKLLKNIPTFVVTDPYPALTGLTQKVAYLEDTKK